MTTGIEIAHTRGQRQVLRGYPVLSTPSPLTRLNYFDGKFLRAKDLQAEQAYHRTLVAFSNQAGGHGVVHGYDTTLGGSGTLAVGAGLAVNPNGEVLLLPDEVSIGIQVLIDASQAIEPALPKAVLAKTESDFAECDEISDAPTGTVEGTTYYLITVGPAYAKCGEEDVFGRLCEDGCATSTDRPHIVDGITLRAHPISLPVPLPASTSVAFTKSHLRSRFASAYFTGEKQAEPSLISGPGLEATTWCLGAEGVGGSEVPLAVVARQGVSTLFLDAWVARRERMETNPRRYWNHKMAMRPWDVYLAQVLQFQCQLGQVLAGEVNPTIPPGLVDKIRECIEEQEPSEDGSSLSDAVLAGLLEQELGAAYAGIAKAAMAVTPLLKVGPRRSAAGAEEAKGARRRGALLLGGIVELPPAGYLPVSPGAENRVDQQVRALLGDGLDLRFCAVRPDFVGEAFEEAQHMDRISLTRGLDDPKSKPEVDILVPDGDVLSSVTQITGTGFDVRAQLTPERDESAALARGVARFEQLDAGGFALYAGGAGAFARGLQIDGLVEAVATPTEAGFASVRRVDASAHTEAMARTRDTLLRMREAVGEDATARTPTPRGEARQLWAWSELRLERDLTEMGPQDIAPVRMVLAGGASAAEDTFVHAVFEGVITDVQVVTSAQLPRIVARFKGSTVVDRIINGQTSETDRGQHTDIDVFVTFDTAGDAGRLRVAIRKHGQIRGSAYELTLEFAGDPITGSARLESVTNSDLAGELRATVATADFTETSEVFDPGHAAHIDASGAIEILGAKFAKIAPGFASRAAAQLLSGRTESTGVSTVKATRDWVMFHRRRVKDCGRTVPPPEPPKPPAPPSVDTVVIYHLPADNADHAAALCESIPTGDVEQNVIGMVDFLEGSTVMASHPREVATEIMAAVGKRLDAGFAVVAPELEIATLRLRAIGDAGVEFEEADVDACEQRIQGTPQSLGFEGHTAAFLITLPAREEPIAETTCHQVVSLAMRNIGRGLEVVKEAALAGRVAAILGNTDALGVVEFTPDAGEVHGQLGDMQEVGIMVKVSQAGAVETPAVVTRQSAVIQEMTGFTARDVEVFTTPDLALDCPHLWILLRPLQ